MGRNRIKKPTQLPRQEYLDDYYDFVYNTVKHYNANGARVKFWQIQNEPNGSRWKAKDEDGDGRQDTPRDKAGSYSRLLKIGATAVRDACSECKVVLSLSSGIIVDGATFLRELILIGGAEYFDIIDFHSNYWPEREKNEGIDQYKNIKTIAEFLRRIMKEMGAQKPLWVSEIGATSGVAVAIDKKGTLSHYSRKYGLYTYEFQAEEVIKRFVIGLGSGVERMVWNKFSNQGLISKQVVSQKESGAFKGLVNINLEKKPAYYAFGLLTKKLKGFTQVKAVTLGVDIYAYQFKVDGGDIYVLWAEKESTVDLKMGKLKVTGIDGEEKLQENSSLLLTDSPIFIEDMEEGIK